MKNVLLNNKKKFFLTEVLSEVSSRVIVCFICFPSSVHLYSGLIYIVDYIKVESSPAIWKSSILLLRTSLWDIFVHYFPKVDPKNFKQNRQSKSPKRNPQKDSKKC